MSATSSQPSDEHALLRDAARSQMLRRLASSLRHDLNSPLQAAIWAFDLIERGLAAAPDSAQRAKVGASVDMGRRELVRLQRAVRLFLGSAAPLDDEHEVLDLRDLLAEVEQLVGAEASLRAVQLQFSSPPAPVTAKVARSQIQQAWLLLTLQAMDAAGAGGQVDVVLEAPGEGQVRARIVHVSVPATATPPAAGLVQDVVRAIAEGHGGLLGHSEQEGHHEVTFTIGTASGRASGTGTR